MIPTLLVSGGSSPPINNQPVLTVSGGGTSSLAEITVTSIGMGNAAPRGFFCHLVGNGTDWQTGYKLGTKTLLAVPAGTYSGTAAVRDENGLWSEYSLPVNFNIAGFSPGNIEASIGSAARVDHDIQNPGVEFPDLSAGSGRSMIRRTMISTGQTFVDEVRSSRWNRSQSVFHLIFTDLDQWQTQLLERFFRALNGAHSTFLFDWYDPRQGTQTGAPGQRYLVRFRDPNLVSKLFDIDRSSFDFYLIEVIEDVEGGDN